MWIALTIFIDDRLLGLLAGSDAIADSIQRIVNEGQTPKLNQNYENNDDGDIYALAKRVSQVLQKIRESSNRSQKKQR